LRFFERNRQNIFIAAKVITAESIAFYTLSSSDCLC